MLKDPAGPALSRILVVDDDIQVRKLLVEALDPRKYQVETLPSGLQLTDALKEESPDLVILDVSLPWRDGFDLCQSIKSNPRWKDTPVLFLTGRRAPADRARGLSAGADGYLTKPFRLDDLASKVSQLLER